MVFSTPNDYSRVHALVIIQPYNRVLLYKANCGLCWNASITRALIQEPAVTVMRRTLKAMFSAKSKSFIITTIEHSTIDEIDYTLLIAELREGQMIKARNDIYLEFVPINSVLDEILDDTRDYSDDSIRTMVYLSPRIRNGRIGSYTLGG